MVTLTDEDLVYFRTQLGTTIDEDDLQLRYDRLGDLGLVAKEVLEQRLADLLASPTQFTVVGEYSQNTGENVKALREQIENLASGSTDAFGMSVVQIAKPVTSRWR